ncbi:MAG: hypothetical protein GF355_08545 [Candidatus Eisenbacteria bacterium]|nr:hypothetical protein [Candidatus Eisenbacteria bacterium]
MPTLSREALPSRLYRHDAPGSPKSQGGDMMLDGSPLTSLVWFLLALASCLALGLLLDGFWLRLRLDRAARRGRALLARARDGVSRECRADGPQSVQGLRRELAALKHPVSDFYRWLLNPDRTGDPELKAVMIVRDLDKGRTATSLTVARLAPLLGLGGTVLGVMQSLAAFSNDSAQQSRVLEGFSTALTTTLAGVLIAAVALVAASVYRSLLQKMEHECGEALLLVGPDQERHPGVMSTVQGSPGEPPATSSGLGWGRWIAAKKKS